MTSFWCFSIKRFGTRFAEAELFFSMKPFYSTNRLLSAHRARPGLPFIHSPSRWFAASWTVNSVAASPRCELSVSAVKYSFRCGFGACECGERKTGNDEIRLDDEGALT